MTPELGCTFLLLFMILAHIIEDFHLQGRMAYMKQLSWWMNNTKDKMFWGDYRVVLILHGFEWAMCVSIPVFICAYMGLLTIGWEMVYIILVMAVIHAVVDDLKCNKYRITLIEDQCIHLIQIMIMWLVAL